MIGISSYFVTFDVLLLNDTVILHSTYIHTVRNQITVPGIGCAIKTVLISTLVTTIETRKWCLFCVLLFCMWLFRFQFTWARNAFSDYEVIIVLYPWLMYRCLHGTAPPYLMDSSTLTAEVTGRQHLRSATQRKLIVPGYRLNSFGRQHFSVAGPLTWNLLPDSLRDPELSLDTFKRQLKTYIFAKYWWQNVLSTW